MRCVIQRVLSASVEVDGEVVTAIGPGLLALVGLAADDAPSDAEWLAKQLLRARIWPSADGERPWDRDVAGIGGELLLVSQFTLHGRFKKPRPDFSRAMAPADARAAYDAFVARVREMYAPDKVKDGVFGAMMRVSLVNDGPVTFCYDSRDNGGGNGGGATGKSSGSSLSTMAAATAVANDGGGGGNGGGL